MTQKHVHLLLTPLSIVVILAVAYAIAIGGAYAQEAEADDYGIWYVQGEAEHRGGFLFPGEIVSGNIHEPADKSAFTPDRDGFLVYFGEDDDFPIDGSYFVGLSEGLAEPLITVSTFYDSPYIEYYANHYGLEVRSFAGRLGLESSRDSVQTVPVGHRVARNERGTTSVTFTPVPGDIGAYLIVVASYDPTAHGDYHVTLLLEE